MKNLPKGAPVAFCQHGLMSAANDWIANKPSIAPAFQLARNGYDVWLGNNRGNMNSEDRKLWTTTITADPQSYFNYSFQDLGQHDLPTQINFVWSFTGVEKLTYLGHSQGTSQMYYGLATNQDFFLKRVNLFVALAPVVRMQDTRTSLHLGAKLMGTQTLTYYGAKLNTYSVNNNRQKEGVSNILTGI